MDLIPSLLVIGAFGPFLKKNLFYRSPIYNKQAGALVPSQNPFFGQVHNTEALLIIIRKKKKKKNCTKDINIRGKSTNFPNKIICLFDRCFSCFYSPYITLFSYIDSLKLHLCIPKKIN